MKLPAPTHPTPEEHPPVLKQNKHVKHDKHARGFIFENDTMARHVRFRIENPGTLERVDREEVAKTERVCRDINRTGKGTGGRGRVLVVDL